MPNMNDSQILVASKQQESSMYKLYVSPVNAFTKTSLMEFFSQYANITDIYMSEPNDKGFKWAFVYFLTEYGLFEAVNCIEKDNIHNFKLSRAKPKTYTPNGPKHSLNLKIMNGDASADDKSFVPNCANCKKLTFQQCGSCKNSFCSKECSLDGWRCHTGPCVKIAELIRVDEPNGYDYSLTPTVVNFMKDIKQTNKNFTTKEFANACNSGKGVFNAPPSVPKQVENYWDVECVNTAPEPDKRSHPRNNLPSSFQRKLSISDNDEANKSVAGTAPKKFQKRDDETIQQPFILNNSQKFNNRGSRTDSEDDPKVRNKIMNRKNFTNVEEGEENEPSRRKPFPKSSPSKCRDSDTKEPNRRRTNVDKRILARQSSFKGSARSHDNELKVTKVIPQVHQTDLKLVEGGAAVVVVTSITNHNTFFVAERKKVVQMLKQIRDCAYGSPRLSRVDVDTHCLACFEGDYYRARVVRTDPIEVEYIDYGNRETCSIDTLRVLPESFTKTSPLATKVQIKNDDVAAYKIEENKEVTIFVTEYQAAENCFIVDVL